MGHRSLLFVLSFDLPERRYPTRGNRASLPSLRGIGPCIDEKCEIRRKVFCFLLGRGYPHFLVCPVLFGRGPRLSLPVQFLLHALFVLLAQTAKSRLVTEGGEFRIFRGILFTFPATGQVQAKFELLPYI